MVEEDKADEEAEGVVKEVTKVSLDFGVLWKHILFGTEISSYLTSKSDASRPNLQ